MKQRRRPFSTIIPALALLGLVLAVVLLLPRDAVEDWMTPKPDVVLLVDRTIGLKRGTPVKFGGYKIGRVGDIVMNTEQIPPVFEIPVILDTERYRQYFAVENPVRPYTAIRLIAENPITDPIVEYYQPKVKEGEPAPAPLAFTKKGSRVYVKAEIAGSLLDSLSHLDGLLASISATAQSLTQTSNSLNEILQKLSNDQESQESLKAILSNTEKSTEELMRTMKELTQTIDQAGDLLSGPVVRDAHATIKNVSATAQEVQTFIEQMRNGWLFRAMAPPKKEPKPTPTPSPTPKRR